MVSPIRCRNKNHSATRASTAVAERIERTSAIHTTIDITRPVQGVNNYKWTSWKERSREFRVGGVLSRPRESSSSLGSPRVPSTGRASDEPPRSLADQSTTETETREKDEEAKAGRLQRRKVYAQGMLGHSSHIVSAKIIASRVDTPASQERFSSRFFPTVYIYVCGPPAPIDRGPRRALY